MSESTGNEQTETDDWAAAMAEQATASQVDANGSNGNTTDDWAAAMAEQATAEHSSTNSLSSSSKEQNTSVLVHRMPIHPYFRNSQKIANRMELVMT